MSDHEVLSPARETIRIIPDVEFFGEHRPGSQSMASRLLLVEVLWSGGEIKHKGGLATKILHDRMIEAGYDGSASAINQITRNEFMERAVKRKTKGKRCYSFRLVEIPERWFARMPATPIPEVTEDGRLAARILTDALDPALLAEARASTALDGDTYSIETTGEASRTDQEVRPDQERTETSSDPERTTEDDTGGGVDLAVSAAVAMSLLAQVVEIIGAGSPDRMDGRVRQLEADLAEVQGRLADRLAETNRLRNDKRAMGDELGAVKNERDGLRQRLRIVEANLEKALRADTAHVVTGMVDAEIARVMREAPSGTTR